ncbi:MAG: glycosyltransferase family 2 protein [Deltaproteobacteria bacterium]|nr:glycosyltransferase family 2 protein [Deltaproteobacteria bacterium]
MSGVCVVVPALECGRTVAAVVAGVRATVPGVPVVVVDDGSHDDTGARAAAAGGVVLRHARRGGKGAALATGFAWALARGHDAVATMDGDGQHAPGELPTLLAAHRREPEALVIGARAIARPDGPMPPLNQLGNRFSTYWLGLFAGQPVGDSQSGFRVYPRAVLAEPPRTTGFEVESELLLRAARLGLSIRPVTITTIYQPPAARTSHFRPVTDTLRIIALVLRQTRWPAAR